MAILEDIHERPDKVMAARETFLPINLESSISSCQATGRPFVWIFLHKGLDSFMSNAMYKKIYWPTLQKYILGLIDAGLIPVIYAEGGYNSRLEIIADLPPGKVVYHFEDVDMARAKKVLGKVGCISGNVPNDLLSYGTVQEVEDYCKRLIDDCAPGGGFILDTAAVVDDCKVENMEAMFRVVQGYGKYR